MHMAPNRRRYMAALFGVPCAFNLVSHSPFAAFDVQMKKAKRRHVEKGNS